MKKIIFILFFTTINLFAFGQKLYIWCPENPNIKPRVGFLQGQEVNIIIFDGRIIPEKSKVECSSEKVSQSLFDLLSTSYPSAKLIFLPEEKYYQKPDTNIVTIKIAISAYHAGFGRDISVGIGSVGGNFSYGVFPKGEWNALTSFYVQIFDNRNSKEKKDAKEISEIESKPNLVGYRTAKGCLNSSYVRAIQSLLFYIENYLM
ncbi:hypothetical protein FACS189451_11530 [Bacteroidia bacterium]|nr:hypothetical protein FACS189451_11530 [Bacteroidia bacterium]